jgi:hypothetical protein
MAEMLIELTNVGLCESASGLKLGDNVGASVGANVGFYFKDNDDL